MAIVFIKEIAGRRYTEDQTGDRTYTRRFILQTDTNYANGEAVIADDDFPVAVGDEYMVFAPGAEDGDTPIEIDTEAICVDVDGRHTEDDDPLWWDFECHYSTASVDPDKIARNPMRRSPDEDVSTRFLAKTRQRDITGKLIANSTGDPLEEGITDPDAITILVVVHTRNEELFNAVTEQAHFQCCNNDTWNGFAKESVLYADLKAKERWEGRRYWSVTRVFYVRLDGESWKYFYALDQGHRYKYLDELVTATEGNGQPHAKPILLDGNGGALEAAFIGNPPVNYEEMPEGGAESPIFLRFEIKRDADFNDLQGAGTEENPPRPITFRCALPT